MMYRALLYNNYQNCSYGRSSLLVQIDEQDQKVTYSKNVTARSGSPGSGSPSQGVQTKSSPDCCGKINGIIIIRVTASLHFHWESNYAGLVLLYSTVDTV